MNITIPIECFDRQMIIKAADYQDKDEIERKAWDYYYEWFDQQDDRCCEEFIADQLRAAGFDIIDYESEGEGENYEIEEN